MPAAGQQLSTVLDSAQSGGEVWVSRRDGRMFVIQPLLNKLAPLAVTGVNLKVTKDINTSASPPTSNPTPALL
jgi:antitoxin (DNA-binding transcriptional repressor) of toxin-antitoxin stability system